MWKRVLMFGPMAGIAVAALASSLFVLDVSTGHELRQTLAKTVSIIGIATMAILLMMGALRLGMGSRKPRVDQPGSPPA